MGDASVAQKLIVGQKIGINTTSPNSSLDINGKLNINDTINFTNDKILPTSSIGINTTTNHTNSIILNASNTTISSNPSGSFYVKPIRNSQSSNVLNYDSTFNEIVYKPYTYGQFFSDSTQYLSQNTQTPIVHQLTGYANGITLSGSPQKTRFNFSQIGVYKIGTSILFAETGGSSTSARFWFKKSGVDIPNSGSVVYVPGNNTLTLAYAEIIINIDNISQYIEIFTFTDSDKIEIAYSNSSLDYPGSPGIITTIYQLN